MMEKKRNLDVRALVIGCLVFVAGIGGSYAYGFYAGKVEMGVPNGWIGDYLTAPYVNATTGMYSEGSMYLGSTADTRLYRSGTDTISLGAGDSLIGAHWMNSTHQSTSDLYVNNDVYVQGTNRTDVLANPEQTASYVVWVDGATYYAKNGHTGQIEFSGVDASTVIQSALNALTSGRTWKEKVLLKGVFIADNISVKSFTEIEIQGKITLPANLTSSKAIFTGGEAAGVRLQKVYLHGGVLDGNDTNNPNYGQGINFYDLCESVIGNIGFQNFRQECMYFNRVTESEGNFIHDISIGGAGEWTNGKGIYVLYMKDSTFDGFSMESDTGSYGLEVFACRDMMFTNMMVSTGSNGYYIHSSVEGCTFVNLDADYCGLNGFEIAGINPAIYKMSNKFIGCDSNYNVRNGYLVEAVNYAKFIGCSAYHNGVLGGAYDGFKLTSSSQYNLFLGCQATDGIAPPTQDYGINEVSGNYNYFFENDVRINQLGNIVVTGANSVVKYNLGFVTESSGTFNIALHSTTATITHGLSYTPAATDITITWTTAGGLLNCTSWSVTGIGAATFTVNLYDANGAAKGPSGTVTGSWAVRKTP